MEQNISFLINTICWYKIKLIYSEIYITGTEEGKIYKCSKAYSSQYLDTYEVSDVDTSNI